MSNFNKELGVCYKCGSIDIDYIDTSVDLNVGYEYECSNCGALGTEWYQLVFLENKGRDE